MPLCSIIIPVYNKVHLTRQCLDRLFSLPGDCTFEVIVVDDASRDQTARVMASYGDRVRLVRHAQNRGFAASCNDGAAVAAGDYVVFLNNDTIPLTGWLDALVRHLEATPRAGAVGAKLLYVNNTIQHAGMAINHTRHPYHIYMGFPADHPAVNKSRRFQMVTGACLLMPRQIFAGAGGFDLVYTNGYEDVDLCLRLGEQGYEIHYCPASTLYHLASVSEGRFSHETRNAQRYYQRWAERIQSDELSFYQEDGLFEIIYSDGILKFQISPLLGVVSDRAPLDETEQILLWRAKQVERLLQENRTLRALEPGTALSLGLPLQSPAVA